ncbi:hypothetical protein D3Z53_26405 [Lachnospiraceae bacterium]|nr:hypothetical protein [Lachnospiraceae bacterium]
MFSIRDNAAHPIQPKILTECLQHLEEKGIINRKSYPIVPPRVEYSLTEIGKSLKPVLTHLNDWGMEYQKEYKESLNFHFSGGG